MLKSLLSKRTPGGHVRHEATCVCVCPCVCLCVGVGVCVSQVITFFEEGEPMIDGEPGDLVFVVRAIPSRRWERRGKDLVINETITLLDALTGGFGLFILLTPTRLCTEALMGVVSLNDDASVLPACTFTCVQSR